MRKKTSSPLYSRICNECTERTKKFYASDNDTLVAAVVKHFQNEHPLKPERCHDLVEKSWLPGYDDVRKAFMVKCNEYDALLVKFKDEVAMRNTLATKLNGIIMILRGD